MFDTLRRLVATWIDPENRTLGISPRVDPSSLGGIWGKPTPAGPRVNQANVLGITAFWRGIHLYANTIAALNLDVVEKNARGGSSPALDHPNFDLLHARPNKTIPRFQFWQTLILHALTYSGGYAEIEWSVRGRRALGLHIMDPRSVRPVYNDDRTVQYDIDGHGTLLDASDVIHVRASTWNGIHGYCLVDVAAETLGVAKAQLLYEGKVFGNGALMGGYLEVPGELNDIKSSALRDAVNSVHQGVDRAGILGILTGGAKFVAASRSPVDAQMTPAKIFMIGEIARLLGIPLHMLGVMDGATVGNAEQQAIQFVKFSLLPLLKAIEGELELKLFSPQERRKYSVRHDTKSLERGDLAARTAYYQGMFGMGAITPNQVMLYEGIDPSSNANADKHFIPANNLVALEDWNGQPTQPAASKPPEKAPDRKKSIPGPDADDA